MRWVLASGLLIVSLILLSCVRSAPADPSEAIARLKLACNAACSRAEAASVVMPEGWSLVADQDGLCLRKDARLLCGTCDCGTYGLVGGELVPSGPERGVTCRFLGDPDARTLNASCA